MQNPESEIRYGCSRTSDSRHNTGDSITKFYRNSRHIGRAAGRIAAAGPVTGTGREGRTEGRKGRTYV